MKNRLYSGLVLFCLLLCAMTSSAQDSRQRILLNDDWRFAYGNAADMQKDFTHGTEYFTFLAKAESSNHNRGPSWSKFDDSAWKTVQLPHDWVVDLPYSAEASHSHGYKTVGWKYPETSVGWYRKRIQIPESDRGKHIFIRFDGIFRDAQVFCNGFYLGHEPSGYATQIYNLTEYLNYGGENIITVRADASVEEGWFYEGAGIYRDVWLVKSAPVHVAEFGTYVTCQLSNNNSLANIYVTTRIENTGRENEAFSVVQRLLDAEGNEVAHSTSETGKLEAKTSVSFKQSLVVKNPTLWDTENPYLYTLQTEVYKQNKLIDTYHTTTGLRSICFDPDKGFLLNGKVVKLKGTNLHQDHAGVGAGIPTELWKYRIAKMKEMGSNAIRSSHNPASPAMLDLCDRMGMLVIDENRLMGVNDEHYNLLRRMIERDRNHPCIILWSIGNEEWTLENSPVGLEVTRSMSEFVHQIDPTRPTNAGNAGGKALLAGLDVQGYNYIVQNDIEGLKKEHPDWKGVGTEETSGCGTRDVYFTDPEEGWMASFNQGLKDGTINVIERGWKFYDERPWLGGLFYWTGIDYRGEPNPMKYPATGSQFGIHDYCGYPKDEAFYLKAWWTDEPVLHIFPHWNLKGHEGDSIKVWAYSNCDEVELSVNGKKLGRKPMPKNGHLTWDAIYKPGKVVAKGYKNGKKILEQVIETTDEGTQTAMRPHKTVMKADGQDIIIIDLNVLDKKKRIVPDAMNQMEVNVDGPATLLGYGNGNPGFKEVERPTDDTQPLAIKAFCGKAQLIIRSLKGKAGTIKVNVKGEGIAENTLEVSSED